MRGKSKTTVKISEFCGFCRLNKMVLATGMVGLSGIMAYLFAFVPNSVVSAIPTASSRVAVTLSDIITLRILDSSASSEISNLMLDVTPTPNGVFTKNSMIVEAATSNPTGYKLYMSSIGTNPVNTSPKTESEGNSNSDSTGNSSSSAYTTDLVNVDNTISDSIPTLTTNSSVTEADFRVRNSLYKNKWGYSLADLSITDTSAITYTDIPANTEQRLIDEKEEQTEHGQTPVTIGVNVSSSIASGTYKNKLEFTAIANPIPKDFTLSFDANTEGTVENLPEIMTASAVSSSYTFTIPSAVPTRTGYKIKEYNTKTDGTGDSYSPGDSFEIVTDDADPTSTSKTLYVIWEPINYTISITAPDGGSVSTTNLEVPYGGSNTFEITAKQGYYLSALICPDGYTCSGYETTADGQYACEGNRCYNAIQAQTVTVRNDNTTAGGAITASWALATWTDENGKAWTYVMGTQAWATSSALCPSGYRMPNKNELRVLAGVSGDTGDGTNVANISSIWNYWGYGLFWSSTSYNANLAYFLYALTVDTTGVLNYKYSDKTGTIFIVCTK